MEVVVVVTSFFVGIGIGIGRLGQNLAQHHLQLGLKFVYKKIAESDPGNDMFTTVLKILK